MAEFAILSIVVCLTLFSFIFFMLGFITLVVTQGKLFSVVVALSIATISAITLWVIDYPPSAVARLVVFPVNIGGISLAAVLRKEEWLCIRNSPAVVRSDLIRDVGMVVGGSVVATIGVLTEVGRPILLAFNYDVRGNTSSERMEIAIAGIVLGFLCGAFLFLFLYAIFRRFFP